MGGRWVRAVTIAAVGVALGGVAAAPAYGPLATLPATLALAGVVYSLGTWPGSRRRVAVVTGAVATVSLAVTAAVLLAGRTYDDQADAASAWAMAEIAALAVLTVLTIRVAPARQAIAAGGAAAVAVPAWLLRFGAPDLVTLVAFAAWGLLVSLAAILGLYLRSLDHHRARSVAEARRDQRLHLARDLHDFVAHDVSAMLAQAQAGQILAEQDPHRAAHAFRDIEEAGLRAMATLDRTVRMLHHTDDVASQPTLADLPELAARFSASSAVQVELGIDPALDGERLPREMAAAAYRIVVEALTNVRRHAPAAGRVMIGVRRSRTGVEVTVTDDGRGRPSGSRRWGGLGLPGLTERIQALGGTLSAGPRSPVGWHVTAVLPLPQAANDR
jgi:signal transduction histidine kinase